MCQVNNFNVDHERNVKACNCCKNRESAAAVSATFAERDRIVALLKELKVIRNCSATNKLVYVDCDTLEVKYLIGLTANNE